MAQMKHATLGASSASRWLACAGSVRMSAGLKSTTSVYAAEGTAAHDLGERCLREKTDAMEYLGEEIHVGDHTFPVTEEMVDAVQIYLATIRADFDSVMGAAMVFEHKFKLDWLYPGMYGYNDAMVSEPFGCLRVYDFKYGAGVAVEVDDNPQLMYYGLGAAKDMGFEEVELIVVQPRAIHPMGPVRRERMPVAELMRWAHEVLLPGAKATEAPDAPLIVGEHCRFCPALALCPEQRKKAMIVAAEVFAPVPSAPPTPEAMDLKQLRKVLDVADALESWLKACKSYARTLLDAGTVDSEVLGYKLVEGRATRSWRSEEEAAAVLKMALGEEAYITKLVSPAQAEKLMKGAAGKKALAPLIESVHGVQMVSINDKRTKITSKAASAFDAVDI